MWQVTEQSVEIPQYFLPSINDLLHKLHGAEIFMKLDIQWGYNNIRIKEGDEWKGAFITKRGLFKLTVMNVLWNDQFTHHIPIHDE